MRTFPPGILCLLTAYLFSLSFGVSLAQETDARLVGNWVYTINDSRGSGATFVDKVTRVRWVFYGNGTYERGASLGGGLTREAARTSTDWTPPTERGMWYSERQKLYITQTNGQAVPAGRQFAGTYYIEGNTMVFTDSKGKKAIWHR